MSSLVMAHGTFQKPGSLDTDPFLPLTDCRRDLGQVS